MKMVCKNQSNSLRRPAQPRFFNTAFGLLVCCLASSDSLAATKIRPTETPKLRIAFDTRSTHPDVPIPCGAGRNKNVRAACDAACEAGILARENFCREFTPAGTPLRAACWKMARESIQHCHNWCAWYF